MGESAERSVLFAQPVPQQLSPNLPEPTTNELQQLTKSHDYTPGWSFLLVLAGVVTTIGSSVPVGYHIGVVNTPAKIISSFCNESLISRYDIHLEQSGMNILWSFVVSIFIMGGCPGSIMGAYLANKLGRKRAIMATSVLSIFGGALFMFCRAANSVEMLVLGRLIVGLASGLTTSIVPMYLAELAPPNLTGAMGVYCPMGVNVGVLVGQIMGLDFLLGKSETWPALLAFCTLLVIICLPILFVLPESPKYLFVIKRDEEQAIKELSRLRGVSPSLLKNDLEILREELTTTGEQSWSMLDVVRDSSLLLPVLLVMSMQAGQQMSGINAVFYYSTSIFETAGLSAQAAQYANIGCGAINVCTALLMIRLLPRCGRRSLLLGSIAASAVLLATLAVSMLFINAVSWMPLVCIAAVLLYVLAYGFGLGPIPYFIASEMFEVGPRPAAMSWGSLSNWGGNFVVGMSFPSVRDVIGPYSFLVFAAIAGALFVFQKLYFPETRGKTPAQVTQACSGGFRSRPPRLTPADV